MLHDGLQRDGITVTRYLARSVAICAATLGLALAPAAVRAEQYLWNIPGEGNWTGGNWNLAGVPDNDDVATIGQGAGLGGTAIVNSSVPTFDRWFLGGSGFNSRGALQVRPGGVLRTTGPSANSVGITGAGMLTVTGGLVSMAGRLDIDNGEVSHSGGRVETTDTSLGQFRIGLALGAPSRYTLFGDAQLDIAGQALVGFGGMAEFTQIGGQMHAQRELVIGTGGGGQGTYIFRGGELTVDGGLALGRGGDGVFRVQSATGTIQSAAFSVADGSALEAVVNGGLAPIVSATPADLEGELRVRFDSTPAVGSQLTLVRTTNNQPQLKTFRNLPEGGTLVVPSPLGRALVQITYNGNVDGGAVGNDIVLTTLTPQLFQGDVDANGAVNRGDLWRLTQNLGKTAHASWLEGDLDRDGDVSVYDLGILQSNFGLTIPVASPTANTVPIPEPASALLATLLGAAALAFVRRRRA